MRAGEDLGTLDGDFIGRSDYWHRIIIRRDGLTDKKEKGERYKQRQKREERQCNTNI